MPWAALGLSGSPRVYVATRAAGAALDALVVLGCWLIVRKGHYYSTTGVMMLGALAAAHLALMRGPALVMLAMAKAGVLRQPPASQQRSLRLGSSSGGGGAAGGGPSAAADEARALFWASLFSSAERVRYVASLDRSMRTGGQRFRWLLACGAARALDDIYYALAVVLMRGITVIGGCRSAKPVWLSCAIILQGALITGGLVNGLTDARRARDRHMQLAADEVPLVGDAGPELERGGGGRTSAGALDTGLFGLQQALLFSSVVIAACCTAFVFFTTINCVAQGRYEVDDS